MADYLDNFTDPNGTLIESHTADSGHKYATGSEFKIQDNRLYGDLPDGTYFTRVLESDGVTDYVSGDEFDLEFDYRLLANQGNLGFYVCATDTDNAYFVFVLNGASLVLRSIVGGSTTTLHSEAVSSVAASTGAVRLEVRDTTVELFLNGTSVFSTTNTDQTRAGKVYIRTSSPEGPTSGWHFDRASLTNLAASTPTFRKSSTFDIETTLGTITTATLDGVNVFDHLTGQVGTTVSFAGAATDEITTSGEYDLVLGDGATTETIAVQVNVVGLPSNTARKDGGLLVSLTDLTLDAVNASGDVVKQLTGLTTNASGVISPVDLSDISEAVGDTLKVSLHSAASEVGVTFEQALENI